MRTLLCALTVALLSVGVMGCSKSENPGRAFARKEAAGAKSGDPAADTAPPAGPPAVGADAGEPRGTVESKVEDVTGVAPVAPDRKPATAEAMVGSEKMPGRSRNEPQSGLLTAGSFDDNLDPRFFRSFLTK